MRTVWVGGANVLRIRPIFTHACARMCGCLLYLLCIYYVSFAKEDTKGSLGCLSVYIFAGGDSTWALLLRTSFFQDIVSAAKGRARQYC